MIFELLFGFTFDSGRGFFRFTDYDSAINKARLKKNGVRVISAKENISDDASGILVENDYQRRQEATAIDNIPLEDIESALEGETDYSEGRSSMTTPVSTKF